MITNETTVKKSKMTQKLTTIGHRTAFKVKSIPHSQL